MDAPGAPAAPRGRTPLGRPQTTEELAFYAKNHSVLTVLALILFLPLGLGGLYFSRQTNEDNKCSNWEDAYRNSTRTIWFDVLAIIVGFGLIYTYILVL